MAELATTRMSSKGQVVIPEDVRDRLGLMPGDQFVVVGEGDVVILKTISPPAMKEFDGLVSKARSQARRAGMKQSDVTAAIRKVRSDR
jgi:AbrB family looped-hinge helix DNA binding protein